MGAIRRRAPRDRLRRPGDRIAGTRDLTRLTGDDERQVECNEAHGITPESIKSQFYDIISDVTLRDGVLVETGEDERPHFGRA